MRMGFNQQKSNSIRKNTRVCPNIGYTAIYGNLNETDDKPSNLQVYTFPSCKSIWFLRLQSGTIQDSPNLSDEMFLVSTPVRSHARGDVSGGVGWWWGGWRRWANNVLLLSCTSTHTSCTWEESSLLSLRLWPARFGQTMGLVEKSNSKAITHTKTADKTFQNFEVLVCCCVGQTPYI